MTHRLARQSHIAALAAFCGLGALATGLTMTPTKAQVPPEASNMRLVGYNDLLARSAYQPTIHKQGNRYIAYIGHHGNSKDVPKPVNRLTGQAESNGTSILDVTDPANPKYLKHIPGAPELGNQGGAQMTRICEGTSLPRADRSKVYLLRTLGTKAHETWDVTDPENPKLLATIGGSYRDTHKNWWECETGIAYLVSGVAGWRARRMTEIYDLSDPAKPIKIRDFGLPGQEPGSTGAVPTDVHGPISMPEVNRVYFGYGTSTGGILQIVDREKLLKGPKEPTPENLRYPEISKLVMYPMVGAHTTQPMLGMEVAEFAHDGYPKRDFVMIVNKSTRNECKPQAREMVFFADITVETHPMVVSNFNVREVERQLLLARRPIRRAFLQREHGAGVLQEARHDRLLQRRASRDRCARSLHAEGGRLLHSVGDRGDRQALRPGRGHRALQGGDPDQQRGDRRPRLHLHR